MKHRTIMAAALAAVAALLVGCGASAPSNELVTARQTLEEARKGEAAQYRPDELHRAERTLALAEGAHEEEPAGVLEQDLAYIADRQARLAMTNARRDALAQRQEQAENQYRRQLEQRNRERQQAQRALDERLRGVNERLEDVREELQQREADLGAQAEELRAREQALMEQQQALEQERLARAQAEMAAMAALEELAQVRNEQDRMIITLNGSVLFATAQTDLLPSARRRLEAVADVLRQHPDRTIVIEGHTDARGTDQYNERLSQGRADSVRQFLISQGVPPEQLRAVGRGEAEPVATNATSEGRANNRRVEIIVENAQAK